MANYKVIDADGHVRESIAGYGSSWSRAGNAAICFPTTRGTVICAASWARSRRAPRIR